VHGAPITSILTIKIDYQVHEGVVVRSLVRIVLESAAAGHGGGGGGGRGVAGGSVSAPLKLLAAQLITAGAAAVASFQAAVLAEIYLCNVCSCQEMLRRNGRG
jgi:hypothetical protein